MRPLTPSTGATCLGPSAPFLLLPALESARRPMLRADRGTSRGSLEILESRWEGFKMVSDGHPCDRNISTSFPFPISHYFNTGAVEEQVSPRGSC